MSEQITPGERKATLTAADDSSPPPGADSPPASAAGRYQLLHELARGGMGIVYRAADTALGREVAVKVLQARYAPGSAAARRFLDEARIAGQLQHPGVPAVHDLGTLPDGRPFLAMKLIRGRTLDELLRDRADPAQDRGQLVAVFEQVCQAVGYAHAKGVIHRDLKPANVMVGAFGEVQVMDWGLAKLLTGPPAAPADAADDSAPAGLGAADATATTAETAIRPAREGGDETHAGSVLGTPAYMPPEQARGAVDQLDARSDVFGLGAVLCAILTGKPPYRGADAEATRRLAAQAKLDDAFTRLDGCGAEPELVALCQRCLAAEQADRPADAGAVAQAVAGLRAAAEERARQAELERIRAEGERARAEAEAREQRRRRRAQLALLAAVGLLLAAGGAFAWWQDRQAAERRARLARNADALAALLDGGTEALRAGDADRADALLKEAARRLPEGGGDDLRDRLDARRADLAVLRDLDAVDQFRWTPVESKFPDPKGVVARLRAALARFGLAPGQTPTEEAARRITASAVRDRLVAALDRWLQMEPSAALRALLRTTDPDPYRDAVRDSAGARLAALAGRPEALAQPVGFLAVLSESPAVPVERRRALLGAAVWRRPGDLQLLIGLGLTYPLNRREVADERVRWFQAALAAYPKNVVAFNSLGIALRTRGDLDGAITAYRMALGIDPKFAPAHNGLGNALLDKGDVAGAVAAFKKALRLDPKSTHAQTNLANALRAKGDVAGAVAAFKKALRLDRENPVAHNGLGLALRDRGDPDGAVAAFKEALRLDPNDALAHSNLGLALQDKGDVAGAVAAHREALRLDPRLAPAHYNLGRALWAKGDVAGAVAAYREALRLDPKLALAHHNLGVALRAKGDLDGAIAAYREALRLDPKYAPTHYNLGHALWDRGDPDGAVTAFKEALRLDPKFALAHNGLGVALRGSGDLAGAVAAYREALRLDPKDAFAHSNLGNALRDGGDLDGAIAAFKEALRLGPKLAPLHYNLGSALREKGDLDGAAAAYREALMLDPKHARARNSLGLTELLRQLLPRLPDLAAGRSDPESSAEAATFAFLCAQPFQKRYALAVRLYERAFAAGAKLADNAAAVHRYNAARCAALAAAGKAKDGEALTPADRAALRGKALTWLRANLAVYRTQAASADPAERKQAAAALAHWLRDKDLDGVRPGADRAGWTPDEAAAWDRLWAEVRAARDQATRPAPQANDAPPPQSPR